MSLFLKKFETISQYNAYTADTENFILPNVSLTVDNSTVHYNPSAPVPPTPTETRVVAKYYVESAGSPITLFYSQGGSGSGSGSGGEPPFSSMEIDGVEQSEVVNEYTFDTTGEHTVKYTLTDPTSISEKAFYYCSSLTSIDIPNSVTSIGGGAFNNCSGLTSVTIPNSVTSIGEWAFATCTGLTSIVIPSGVTSIGSNTFDGCYNLTSIDIPSGVTNISNHAFYQCYSLTSIDIPSGVTSIGAYAFTNCSGLISITVDSNNTVYDSRNNCNAIIETNTNTLIQGCNNTVIPNTVTSIGDSAFKLCRNLTSINIPNSVTSIGYGAFSKCRGLTSVTIPNSVTIIGTEAFAYCSGLTSVTVNATTPPALGTFVFNNNASGRKIYVPSASVDAYKSATNWSTYASDIEPIP